MDTMSTGWSFAGSPERKVQLRGRCKRCWGGLLGRRDKSGVWTGMKCRICGLILEGAEAAEEYSRLQAEIILNIANMDFGQNAEYGEGPFLLKVIPTLERLTEEELNARIAANPASAKRERKLTRSSFPAGTPGFLFLQAGTLLEGIGPMRNPDQPSVAQFPEVDVGEDGTLIVHYPIEELKEDPNFNDRQMRRSLGKTMVEGMVSAFACELAMKAICLTCEDEAIKDHDLLDLYRDLPQDSRLRIETDYPEIEALMKRSRGVFGKWRYFEKDIGEQGMMAMLALERARDLSKAARVMRDEGIAVGLGETLKMEATRNVRVVGQEWSESGELTLKVIGGESPPRN